MNRFPALVLCLWGCFAWGLVPAAAQDTSAFEVDTHDFGEVAAGDRVSTTFEFTNRTSAQLRIEEVRPSCGCTVPDYSAEYLDPGATGEIVVEFDSENRNGEFRHSVAVVFVLSSGDRFVDTVEIRGAVVPAQMIGGDRQGGVRFDRSEVDLGALTPDQTVRHRFMMQRVEGREMSILAAYSFPEGANITFPERPIFRDEVVFIVVEVPTDMVHGELDLTIALQTDDRIEPVKVLSLSGHAR